MTPQGSPLPETRRRLTEVERAERKVAGDDLQQQIADLAVLLGWDWLHVGALRTKFGWKTPTRGTLSAWPDLTLVRARDRRLVFAECKRELEAVRPDQAAVLDILRSLAVTFDRGAVPSLDAFTQVEVAVWRPSDLRDPIETSRIYAVLR
jgi:hypothetical protein